jgi:hypothetical protein
MRKTQVPQLDYVSMVKINSLNYHPSGRATCRGGLQPPRVPACPSDTRIIVLGASARKRLSLPFGDESPRRALNYAPFLANRARFRAAELLPAPPVLGGACPWRSPAPVHLYTFFGYWGSKGPLPVLPACAGTAHRPACSLREVQVHCAAHRPACLSRLFLAGSCLPALCRRHT